MPSISLLNMGWSKRLPVILQTEAAECGLVCLAMIAGYYGLRTDLSSLRRRFPISLKGITLKGVIELAKALRLSSRPLRVELGYLSQLQCPCILHWDMNHFVVMKEIRNGKVILHDPAVGLRIMPLEEFSKHFTGVALELLPTQDFSPGNEAQKFTLLSLMGGVIGLKRGLAQILLMALALEVTTIVAPFYMQWTIDNALVNADKGLVSVLGLGFALLVAIQACIGAVRGWMITVLSINLNFQWLGNVFAHLLRLPLEYFEKRHTGDIVSRFNSISTIQRTLTTDFVQALVDGLLVSGTFAMMLIYSAQLASIAAVAVFLYCLLRFGIYRTLREATAEQIIHSSKQQTHFMETARGVQSVRLFGRSDERRAGWLNMLVEQFNADIRIQRAGVVFQTANTFLFGIERVLIIWMAALAVLRHELSTGMLFAFIAYELQFSGRITGLIDKLFEFKMLRLHGERVADIVLAEPEDASIAQFETDSSDIHPSIEIKNLGFRYSPTEQLILDDIGLNIAAGECVAITGPSGCGKTTLIKVLLGLLTPTSGEIQIGGMSMQQLGLEQYRKMVGTVMQDDTLFSGSIADNISFFDPMPDQSRIEAAAKQAAIHAEISRMPMGYNSLVGDIGSGMSGGQKQRVLLARALYKQPKILILDEATSHLDISNERLVNEAVKSMQLTRIIIAHRPETIAMAQRVVVLAQGKVIRDFSTSDALSASQ